MSQLRVLIVGASIAGPTAAYWFARAGARVTVIERCAELRTGGQNIDIRSIGVTTMRKMPGLEDAVRAKTAPLDGLSLMRSNGRSYGVLRGSGDPDQQTLLSEYEIFRGDLCRVLYDMTKDHKDVSYIFGEQIASMQQHAGDGGTIHVDFANGTPSADYDLVVACDGSTSRTRAIGLGGGVHDYIQSVNAWAAYFPLKQKFLTDGRIGLGYSAPPGRFVSVKQDLAGVDRVMLMRIHPRGDANAMLPFRAANKEGDAALKKLISQQFSGIGWRTDDLVGEMMNSEGLYASEVVQVKPPALYKGRFVMVGDAGYGPGPTGAGTSLAMAGGYLLAGEIWKHHGDLDAGLRGYEERMRPLIKDLQVIPPFVPGAMAPQTVWATLLRNWIFAVLAWSSRITTFLGRFFSSIMASTDQYPLPEYEWPT